MASVYPKQFFRNRPPRVKRATCFVVMPFHADYANVYAVIRDTLQSSELNLLCVRGDDLVEANILESILRQISQSEFVVADLTGRNPNVFYELGVAHCHKDPESVVLLAQSIEDVPFDLRHLRCIHYSSTEPGLLKLRANLLSAFGETAKRSFRFKLRERQRFAFGRKLVGRNKNLFSIAFECPHVGLDAVKLLVHFIEHAIDEVPPKRESQFLFLSEDAPSVRLENIPWEIHLVEASETEALLSLAAA